jgi:hypothetical protein
MLTRCEHKLRQYEGGLTYFSDTVYKMVYGMQVDGFFGACREGEKDVGARIKIFKKCFKKAKKKYSQKKVVEKGTKLGLKIFKLNLQK